MTQNTSLKESIRIPNKIPEIFFCLWYSMSRTRAWSKLVKYFWSNPNRLAMNLNQMVIRLISGTPLHGDNRIGADQCLSLGEIVRQRSGSFLCGTHRADGGCRRQRLHPRDPSQCRRRLVRSPTGFLSLRHRSLRQSGTHTSPFLLLLLLLLLLSPSPSPVAVISSSSNHHSDCSRLVNLWRAVYFWLFISLLECRANIAATFKQQD